MNRCRSDTVHVFCADAEVLFDHAGIIQGSFCVPDSISFLKVCVKLVFAFNDMAGFECCYLITIHNQSVLLQQH
jgi:hypothetical protein